MSSFDQRSVRFENIPAWYNEQKVQHDFQLNNLSVPEYVQLSGEPSSIRRTWGIVVFRLSDEARYLVEAYGRNPNLLCWSDTQECAWLQVDAFLIERPRAEGVVHGGELANRFAASASHMPPIDR